MNKFLEILIGIFFVVIPLLIVILIPEFHNWGLAAIELLKGAVVVILILAGLLFIMLGISDLKG